MAARGRSWTLVRFKSDAAVDCAYCVRRLIYDAVKRKERRVAHRRGRGACRRCSRSVHASAP